MAPKFQRFYFELLATAAVALICPSHSAAEPGSLPFKVNPKDVFQVVHENGRVYQCAPRKGAIVAGTLRGKSFTPFNDDIKNLQKKVKRLGSGKAAKKIKKQIALKKTLMQEGNSRCRKGSNEEATLDPITRALTREDVRSFLEKAGFGLSSKEEYLVTIAEQQGASAFVDAFMTLREDSPTLMARVLDRRDGQVGSSTTQSPSGQRQALLDLWSNTANPYSEKLALFLLSVWTVAGDVIGDETFRGEFWDYYSRLRQSAAADTDLPQLGVDISRDPLMLIYLNNDTNTKTKPNENYARELMELFTLGPVDLDQNPNYTETTLDGNGDIAVAARMLTGWKTRLNYTTNQIDAQYDGTLHANGPHQMFPNKPWAFSGETEEDLVRGIFAHHPGVKNYYASEILKAYLTPNPPRALVESFGAVIAAHNYKLRPAMRELFKSKAFFDQQYRDTLPKNSIEYTVESIRTLGLFESFNPGETDRALVEMGMPVNLAPSVFWFNTSSFTSPSVLLGRSNLIAYLIGDTTAQKQSDPDWSPLVVLPSGTASAADVITAVALKLGIGTLSEDQRAGIIDYMNKTRQYNNSYQSTPYNNSDSTAQQRKGMGVYYILMAMPEFQLK